MAAISEYLARNVLLIGAGATLPGVFVDNPKPEAINVPLWTLKYEVLAYASIAALTVLSDRFMGGRHRGRITLVILFATAATMLSFGELGTHGKFEHAVRLAFAFYLGVAAWQWRHRLKAKGLDFALLTLANVVMLLTDFQYAALQILWLAYGGLWLGTRTYGWISEFTDRQDYSYGIYIIGFPVQQAVVATTGILDPWANLAISLPIVLILACCSWNLVEKPALRLKKSLPRLVSAQSS